MAMEYYSFEKVLSELQMEEDELKRLVSEGEIRAFRDEDKMKFKKSDIEGLKKGRMTEPTIILPSGGGEEDASDEGSEVLLVEDDTSETLLDIDDLDEDDATSSTSVPTVDFSAEAEEDSSAETLTEELVFGDESDEDLQIDDSDSDLITEDIGSEETFVDDSTGMTTEPLDIIDDESSDEVMAETGAATQVAPTRGPRSRPRRTVAPRAVAPAASDPLWTSILILSTIVMLFAGFLGINTVVARENPVTMWFNNAVSLAVAIPAMADDPTLFEGNGDKKISDAEKQKYLQWRANVYKKGDEQK